MKGGRGLGVILLFGIVVRFPFWLEALRTPLDGDTAIVGLMARHPFASATLWGQPYGSPLDAWYAIPFLAALGPRAAALRVGYFVLGLGLIPLAYLLGTRLHPRAGLPAAFLMACPAPYMLLLSALPPPLYPTTLVLCGALLWLAVGLGDALDGGGLPRGGLVLAGTLAGLALWTHLMSASVIAAVAAFLAVRARRRPSALLFGLVPLVAASAPWWQGFVTDPEWVVRIVTMSNRDQGLGDHLRETLPTLHRALAGLLGAHTPVIADDPDHVVVAPGPVAAVLLMVYAGAVAVAAWRSRFRGAAGLLVAAIALAVAAFPFPLRSAAHTIRFLTTAYVPLVALVALAPLLLRRGEPVSGRASWVLVLGVATLHLLGAARLLSVWRATDRSAAPFNLADLTAVRSVLAERGIRRAYASYDTAYRMTFESAERLVVSEPWNERFRHYPLPYLDEVRFAKNVAWIFVPAPSGDFPTPRAFEDALNAIGGRFRLGRAGAVVLYDAFEPPFGPTVEPLTSAGLAGDGDLATRIDPDPSQPTTLVLPLARRLDAVSLLAGIGGPPLARSLDVAVSADGSTFQNVASRRRREERHDLRWVGGHPQYVLDHDLLAIPLGGQIVAAIRLSPHESTEPWSISEILLHPAEGRAERRPWDEWLNPGLRWPERRAALAANPRPDREDWYYRVLLAGRAR